jgi:hypothetical protein
MKGKIKCFLFMLCHSWISPNLPLGRKSLGMAHFIVKEDVEFIQKMIQGRFITELTKDEPRKAINENYTC